MQRTDLARPFRRDRPAALTASGTIPPYAERQVISALQPLRAAAADGWSSPIRGAPPGYTGTILPMPNGRSSLIPARCLHAAGKAQPYCGYGCAPEQCPGQGNFGRPAFLRPSTNRSKFLSRRMGYHSRTFEIRNPGSSWRTLTIASCASAARPASAQLAAAMAAAGRYSGSSRKAFIAPGHGKLKIAKHHVGEGGSDLHMIKCRIERTEPHCGCMLFERCLRFASECLQPAAEKPGRRMVRIYCERRPLLNHANIAGLTSSTIVMTSAGMFARAAAFLIASALGAS
jgi:hypothetical protein